AFESAIRHVRIQLPSRLTLRTKVRRPAGQANALDGGPAPRARRPFAAINAKLVLVATFQTGAADVIANARAALVDGPRQDDADGLAEPFGFGGRRAGGDFGRRQPGLEEGFIRINVADAGHDALIEKHRLQAAPGRCQAAAEVTAVDPKRLRPKL